VVVFLVMTAPRRGAHRSQQKINVMLGRRMSLDEIAASLNAQKVPPVHGTNKWTPVSVRKAFVS
jgi:hypothetical protein